MNLDDDDRVGNAATGIHRFILPTAALSRDLVGGRDRGAPGGISGDGRVHVVVARDCVTATSGNLSSFLAALLASLPSADRIELTVAREDEKVARARSASDNTCLGCP